MTLTPGTQLGPYKVTRQLGSGGMGVVYEARDPRLDRTVAVKVLPPDLTQDDTAKERFLQEARAASALDHPNICTIYDVGETDDGQLYLVMAHYDGETLKERMARGALPVDEVVDIAAQVGLGLAKAHAAGIVHRDIKPANLMVATDGTVKILDFGLAKLAAAGSHLDESTVQGLTQTGLVVGTLPYMSPEQVEAGPVDRRSDIFSLGVVMYEAFTGDRPFQGEGGAALAAILKDTARLASELRPQVPKVVAETVQRCLAKRPAHRYQSADDLLHALRWATSGSDAGTGAAAPASDKTIAVLPFTNMSPDPENEFFSDGISEEIIGALGQLPDLRVTARTSSFAFKGKNVDLREVGEKLNVQTVVEGSVRKAGTRVRIAAQLVNVADGYQFWSERYDRELDDVFDVQDEIARTIADRMKVTLTDDDDAPLVKATTNNLEAYELYLKGRALLYKRGPWIVQSLDCFRRAVELDSLLAEGQCALALATLLQDHDVAASKRSFVRAMELNPNYGQAPDWYAMFILSFIEGKPNDGVNMLARSLEQDPLSGYLASISAFQLSFAGRHEEAITAALGSSEKDPSSYITHWALQSAYLGGGRCSEAVAAGHAALAVSERHPWAVATLATTS